ncbi:MAG: HNH endonuclease [Victivallales bacterium]|nr:HNH endonuclease [Victivallales bacterium]
MRPIEKGESPYASIKQYQKARPFLEERLGLLCSYCEMHLASKLEVEHVQPKSRHPEKVCEWSNLLLACGNCNSTKGHTDINDSNIHDYLWPDIDNTFLALQYSDGGIVGVNDSLPKEIQEKAWRLIKLVGLDRIPPDASIDDNRWKERREAWKNAQREKNYLSSLSMRNQQTGREMIITMVNEYFSIWMTVFADDVEMKRMIIEKFIGTASDCFDKDGNPVPRNNGQI